MVAKVRKVAKCFNLGKGLMNGNVLYIHSGSSEAAPIVTDEGHIPVVHFDFGVAALVAFSVRKYLKSGR